MLEGSASGRLEMASSGMGRGGEIGSCSVIKCRVFGCGRMSLSEGTLVRDGSSTFDGTVRVWATTDQGNEALIRWSGAVLVHLDSLGKSNSNVADLARYGGVLIVFGAMS